MNTFVHDHKIYTCEGVKKVNDNVKYYIAIGLLIVSAIAGIVVGVVH